MTEGVALELPIQSVRNWIWLIAFWGSLFLITYLALTPHESPEIIHFRFKDKILHALAFGYLTGLLRWRYPTWATSWRTTLMLLAYGGLIELAQSFIPSRQCSLADMVADAFGILMALALMRLMEWRSKSRQITPYNTTRTRDMTLTGSDAQQASTRPPVP
jgi:VanZ family protein